MSDPKQTVGPGETRARPTPRSTVLAGRTMQLAAAHFERHGERTPAKPISTWLGKLARMIFGALFVGAGAIMMSQAWLELRKAADFGTRHAVMVGLALAFLFGGAFIWTPDRAKDLARFFGTLLTLWRRPPPPAS